MTAVAWTPRGGALYGPGGFARRADGPALSHNYIGAEHILLGLLREGDGLAVRILSNAGVELQQLRRATLTALDPAA